MGQLQTEAGQMIAGKTALVAVGVGVLAFAVGTAWCQPDLPRAAQQSNARQPIELGAAVNFSQGWSEQTFAAAQDLGVTRFRDGISWSDVEREPGQYRFAQRKTQYPARIGEVGARLILTVSGSNPLYDNGETPHSPEAVAAFARFVAAVVREYPAISAIEVGNEFNSGDFVSGPVREGGIAQRARYHLALLEAVASAVHEVRPNLPILGGATHSLPVGYLWSVVEGAEAGALDGLAVHPYTTPIDQLAAQVGVLRRNPRARNLPLQVTEFGTKSEADAPDHMLRGFATMASLGFAALDWYPLNERDDGLVPLIRRDGSITSAGEAFGFIQAQLAGRSAHDISPDPFTFAHAFGEDRLVLWGEARSLRLARDDIQAFDARGKRLDTAQLALSPDHAVVLTSERPLQLGRDVVLGCSTLVADTFYQFSYPRRAAGSSEPVFASVLEQNGSETALETLPGQQRGGVPWFPYLGVTGQIGVRLTAERVVLAGQRLENASIIQHWQPAGEGPWRIEASVTPAPRNAQPMAVTIEQGGQSLFAETSATPMRFSGTLAANSDTELKFGVSRNGAGPASAGYRLRIHDDGRCSAANSRMDAPR